MTPEMAIIVAQINQYQKRGGGPPFPDTVAVFESWKERAPNLRNEMLEDARAILKALKKVR